MTEQSCETTVYISLGKGGYPVQKKQQKKKCIIGKDTGTCQNLQCQYWNQYKIKEVPSTDSLLGTQ